MASCPHPQHLCGHQVPESLQPSHSLSPTLGSGLSPGHLQVPTSGLAFRRCPLDPPVASHCSSKLSPSSRTQVLATWSLSTCQLHMTCASPRPLLPHSALILEPQFLLSPCLCPIHGEGKGVPHSVPQSSRRRPPVQRDHNVPVAPTDWALLPGLSPPAGCVVQCRECCLRSTRSNRLL